MRGQSFINAVIVRPVTHFYFSARRGCPYAQRVRIALKEANPPYTEYEIDLQNKPEWYAPRVNSTSKVCVASLETLSPPGLKSLPYKHAQVPTMTYNGPKVEPSNPSLESFKLAEFVDSSWIHCRLVPVRKLVYE